MATALSEAIPLTEGVWRGGGRFLLGDPVTPPAWPDVMEEVMNLTTFALEDDWVDIGPISDDGFEISQSQDVDEGIPIDQRSYNVLSGRVSNAALQITYTAYDTSIEAMKLYWNAGTLTSVAASVGVNVAQKRLNIGSPKSIVGRRCAIIQQHEETGKLRMFVFRIVKYTESGSFKISSKDPSGVDVTLTVQPDITITDGTDFGIMLTQD